MAVECEVLELIIVGQKIAEVRTWVWTLKASCRFCKCTFLWLDETVIFTNLIINFTVGWRLGPTAISNLIIIIRSSGNSNLSSYLKFDNYFWIDWELELIIISQIWESISGRLRIRFSDLQSVRILTSKYLCSSAMITTYKTKTLPTLK